MVYTFVHKTGKKVNTPHKIQIRELNVTDTTTVAYIMTITYRTSIKQIHWHHLTMETAFLLEQGVISTNYSCLCNVILCYLKLENSNSYWSIKHPQNNSTFSLTVTILKHIVQHLSFRKLNVLCCSEKLVTKWHYKLRKHLLIEPTETWQTRDKRTKNNCMGVLFWHTM